MTLESSQKVVTIPLHICDSSVRNESHVGSVQVEKMGNIYDMG